MLDILAYWDSGDESPDSSSVIFDICSHPFMKSPNISCFSVLFNQLNYN